MRFTPEFTESYLYRGLNLLQVSLLVPFLSRFGWKKWTGALLGFAALFLLPLAFYGEFYTDLCVDGTLALLTAYYLYAWFGRRKRDAFAFLSISLAGAFLVLTKESGLIFALWGLGIIVWDSFNRGQLLLKKLPLAGLTTEGVGGGLTKELFDRPEWATLSESCLGCGTCTFVCPTCQCYDIRDFDTGHGIKRFRCWDSCMYSDFTKMAHGNPRVSQLERFRQRFMHKLVYYPENNEGIFGCVGCGRCLAKCPISMNIVKVMKTLAKGGNK